MRDADIQSHLERYLELRRALGFQMRVESRLLQDFVTFLQGRALSAQVALDWVCSRGGAAPNGSKWQANRLSIVRGFLRHLSAHLPDIEIPTAGIIPSGLRATPYIYSEAQILALMNEARLLKPAGSLRPHTYATLIGLLASCGLRPGEAIRLQNSDVELDSKPPKLVIRQTKFGKSRLVPIATSTTEALRSYEAMRKKLGYDGLSQTFFVSEFGTPLLGNTVGRTFREIIRCLAIHETNGSSTPNLRCLRHSFAVRRILDWYAQGLDVNTMLPHLSVYLGHAKPHHTYWYLTATPELLTTAASRFEAYAGQEGAL